MFSLFVKGFLFLSVFSAFSLVAFPIIICNIHLGFSLVWTFDAAIESHLSYPQFKQTESSAVLFPALALSSESVSQCWERIP